MESSDSEKDRARKAYDALLTYITASARSEKECREKLYQKGYHKDEVEYAIELAKKYRFVNDEEYTRNFLSFYKDKYGAKKLAYKLTTEKGVDREIADRLLNESISEDYELEKCLSTAQKYIKQKHIEDKSGAQKVYAFLYQKGFDYDTISKTMPKLFDDRADE